MLEIVYNSSICREVRARQKGGVGHAEFNLTQFEFKITFNDLIILMWNDQVDFYLVGYWAIN